MLAASVARWYASTFLEIKEQEKLKMKKEIGTKRL
jgi:hypothetical protein